MPEKLPWWFDRDFNGREVTRPAGLFGRFHSFKFDRLFAGFNDLARLADAYGKDEYARRLLDEMISLVSAEGFEPKLAIE